MQVSTVRWTSLTLLWLSSCVAQQDAAVSLSPRATNLATTVGAASAIVVGRVTADAWIGNAVRWPPRETAKVRLRRLSVTVDGVLRGSVPVSSRLNVYRFDCVEECINIALGEPTAVGGRYVFLLEERDSRWRLAYDDANSAIPVKSGYRVAPRLVPINLLISELLLTPGSIDFDASGFADGLHTARYFSEQLVGATATLERVKPLAHSESRQVRESACLILAELRYDYDGCLNRIVEDVNTSDGMRRRANQRLWALEETRRRLQSVFVARPFEWLHASAGSTDKAAVKDQLTILAQHPDRAVRTTACGILRQEYNVDAAWCRE